MDKLENKFQAELIKELKARFPDCIIVKNDSSYIQGIPDITIFKGERWAVLECKKIKHLIISQIKTITLVK